MARSEARISVSIWAAESDFTDLEPLPQWMYFFLLSQPDLSHAGVLALRERRWARAAAGLDVPMIEHMLGTLTAHRFIVVDADAEEVLVRSFIRRDKVYRQPNVLRAARDDLPFISSTIVRRALALELRRVQSLEMPNMSVSIVAEMLDVLAAPSMPDPSGKGSAKGSGALAGVTADDDARPSMSRVHDDTPSSISAGGKGSRNPSRDPSSRVRPRVPYPLTPNPLPQEQEQLPPHPLTPPQLAASPPADDRRGTRLPDDFEPTDAMKDWARKECPLTTYRDHEMFTDHWHAQSGQRAVKRNWVATWRNWMRRTQENRERTNSYQQRTITDRPTRATTDERVAQAAEAGARLQAIHDQKALGA